MFGDELVAGEGVNAVAIDFAGRRLLVAGTVTIRIADFVYVTGSFALEKGDPILVTPVGSDDQVEVSLLRVGISGANVFVGMGVPFVGGAYDPVAAGSIGVALRNVSLALALMRQTPAAPGGPAGALSFTALKVSGSAELLGVPPVSWRARSPCRSTPARTPRTRRPGRRSTSRSSTAACSPSRPAPTPTAPATGSPRRRPRLLTSACSRPPAPSR